MPQLTVRVSDDLHHALNALPREGDRTVTDDHRAGVELVVALARLAELRANRAARARSVERVEDEVGRVVLGVLPRITRDAFYEWAGCDDATSDVPTDRVLEWLAGSTSPDDLADFNQADLLRAREILARVLDERNA